MAKHILTTCQQRLTTLSRSKKVTIMALLSDGDDVQEVICTPDQHYIVTEQRQKQLTVGLRSGAISESELISVVVMLMKMAVFSQVQQNLINNLLEHIARQNDLPPDTLFDIINNTRANVDHFFTHTHTSDQLH